MKEAESKKLGLMTTILLGINGIIGSGIFLLPGKVSALVGQGSLLVYAFVTGLVLAIAWCFAQCAALFHRNGGAYIYAKEAFGEFIGFEIGLMRWVVGITAWAALAVGFVTALSSIWPEALNEPWRSLIILSLIGALGLLNLCGVRLFRHLNNVVTIAKLLPLVFFILAGVFYMKHSHFMSLPSSDDSSASFGSAALIVFYAFGGFETLVVAAGEMKNPTKNLPLAMMTVMSICSILYFLIQMIAMGLLGPALNGSAVPLADATEAVMGLSGKWIVTFGMLISIGGVNISSSFVTPRSGVALAEDGMIPQWIAKRNRQGAPIWAVLITIGLTGFVALSGNFTQLATISVVSRFAQYFSTCLATVVLYYKKNLAWHPVKKGLLILIPLFSLIGLSWLLLQATIEQLSWGLGALILGIPMYMLQKVLTVPSERHSLTLTEN